MATTHHDNIAFIGGGNMASAIINGMLEQGYPRDQIAVVEPFAEAREKLTRHFGITAQEAPGPSLESAGIVVWAVKPQTFKDAALQTRFHTKAALHLSVAAGIRSDSIAHWLGTDHLGRDLYSRMVHGASVAMLVSLSSIALSLTLGTVLVADGLLSYLGPQGWFNRVLLSLHIVAQPVRLVHNYWGVLMSLVIVGFPFAFLLLLSFVTGIDPSLGNAAATLGAPPGARFRHIALPLLAPGLAMTAAVVLFVWVVF